MAFLGNRYIKLLIAFVLVLFFIFVSPNDSQASLVANTRYTSDIWSATRDEYNDCLIKIYLIIKNNWNKATYNEKATLRGVFLDDLLNYNCYMSRKETTLNGVKYFRYDIDVMNYKNMTFSFSNDTFLINYDDNTTDVPRYAIGEYLNVPVKRRWVFYDMQAIKDGNTQNGQWFIEVNNPNPSTMTIWQSFVNYVGDFDMFNLLITSIQNNFQTYDMKNLFVLLNTIKDSSSDNADSTKELTDFVKNDTVDSSSSDFNTQSGVDSSGIDGAIGLGLNSIYSKWQSGDSPDIVFPIPHTSNNITLKGDYVSTSLYQNNAGWIVGFIQLAWSFAIYGWVIKDIYHYFDQMKNGDIVNNKDSNIQTTML